MSTISIVRIIGWVFFSLIYLYLIVISFGLALIFLLPLFFFTYQAYKVDLSREVKATDNFRDTNLFFRYGSRINKTDFSIPVDIKWSDEEVRSFAEKMSREIEIRIQERLKNPGVTTVSLVNILDKDLRADIKDFLKIVFRTRRGSQLSHFVHYAVAGKSIVAHYFTYMRGTYEWHDIVNFVFFGPISIWFWGVSWLNNKYSIISTLSRTIDNSFDFIDINTFYESSYYVLLDETRSFLKDNNLLSEELAQVIFNNISNNNSQNININNSSGLNLGNVSNFVQSAASKN